MSSLTSEAVKIESLENQVITLKSKDSKEFKVNSKFLIKYSGLIKTIIDNDDYEDEKINESIPLANVNGKCLEKIIQFLKNYTDDPFEKIEKPLKSDKLEEIINKKWCIDFLKQLNQPDLFEMTLAANYMDISPLLDLTCAYVASMIKGKTPEEIKKTFDIEEEFTDDDKEHMGLKKRYV